MKTRKPPACDSDAWDESVRQVHEESCGVMQLHIIPPQDVLPLIASAMAGNALAGSLLNPVVSTIKRVQSAPPDAPAECGCCGRPLHRGAVIVVALPNRPDPTAGLAFALCQNCTRDADAVQGKAIEALKCLWPDGRLIEVTHPAGGAA